MVGVFFASVSNFQEMYEEQFNSGTEFIRYQFDSLLSYKLSHF